MCHSGHKCSQSSGVSTFWERIEKRRCVSLSRDRKLIQQISTYSRDTGARSSSSVTLHIITLEKSIPDFSRREFLATIPVVLSASSCPHFSNSGETTHSDLVRWVAD